MIKDRLKKASIRGAPVLAIVGLDVINKIEPNNDDDDDNFNFL
tara:strand:- start:216 stop:344 length:129 start_codon:yes stop_codon:yes gene_type:complete